MPESVRAQPVSSPAPRACVITVSSRAAAGEYADRSGPLLAQGLAELGLEVDPVRVVADGAAVGDALQAAVGAYDLVVTTGGTGLSPTDQTPEQTRPVLDREIPQLAVQIAQYGVTNGVATAALSRGLTGLAGRTLVVNLPGSTGAVKDGLAVLGPLLPHALQQIAGGDH